VQVREFESVNTAMETVRNLRPSMWQSYRLSVVLAAQTFHGNWRRKDYEPQLHSPREEVQR
jgi:hypothetical protein